MQVQNCTRCGKVFSRVNKAICNSCEKEEEAIFQRVKDFINDNPSCTLSEISEATEVSAKKILKFIRDGRIVISDGMKGEIVCEQCHKPIRTGRYCDRCAINLNAEVDEIFGRNKRLDTGSGGAKMRSNVRKKL